MAHVQVSIAEARNHLTRLVHRVERGVSLELTRRGRPVAALLPFTDYERLQRGGVASRCASSVRGPAVAFDGPKTGAALVALLRASGLVGMWKGRADITDSATFARKLRERSQKRRGG